MSLPIEPVTVDGWYQHTDGTWGEYAWVGGFPRCLRTADHPETAEEREARIKREDEAYHAWCETHPQRDRRPRRRV